MAVEGERLQRGAGDGAPGCGSDSAPPPPLARRGSRSRRGHLGNGNRPAPGYGGRRGTSFPGRRRRFGRARAGGGAEGVASVGGDPGGAAPWVPRRSTPPKCFVNFGK